MDNKALEKREVSVEGLEPLIQRAETKMKVDARGGSKTERAYPAGVNIWGETTAAPVSGDLVVREQGERGQKITLLINERRFEGEPTFRSRTVKLQGDYSKGKHSISIEARKTARPPQGFGDYDVNVFKDGSLVPNPDKQGALRKLFLDFLEAKVE